MHEFNARTPHETNSIIEPNFLKPSVGKMHEKKLVANTDHSWCFTETRIAAYNTLDNAHVGSKKIQKKGKIER